MLKAESQLTQEEKTSREQLLQVATVKRSWELVQEFRKLLASRKGAELERWMQQTEATEGAPFKGFLSGVRRDLAAVQNAFSLPWSNGQTEGPGATRSRVNSCCDKRAWTQPDVLPSVSYWSVRCW